MHFQIFEHPRQGPLRPAVYTWVLLKQDGEGVASNVGTFVSEKEARSNITAAKKSMKGAWRCKVLLPGEEPA